MIPSKKVDALIEALSDHINILKDFKKFKHDYEEMGLAIIHLNNVKDKYLKLIDIDPADTTEFSLVATFGIVHHQDGTDAVKSVFIPVTRDASKYYFKYSGMFEKSYQNEHKLKNKEIIVFKDFEDHSVSPCGIPCRRPLIGIFIGFKV